MIDYRLPAEWENQQSLWTAFPYDSEEWHDQLSAAQQEITNFVITLVNHGQKIYLLCRDQTIEALARRMIDDSIYIASLLEYVIMPYGDIWLRDTGPIIVTKQNERRAISFAFNGWGNKFLMQGDQEVARNIAAHLKLELIYNSLIFEGGSIDVDGVGNAITTRQCLLHPNRNPNVTQDQIEIILSQHLGLNNILWLNDGLKGDHTDGHVDNLARFVGPKHILIPKAQNNQDINIQIYEDAALLALKQGYRVSRIDSIATYYVDGNAAPASYMNFVIANDIIIVPQYSVNSDKAALETISALFPNKQVIGLISMALLNGGGSFHCASQQIAACLNQNSIGKS